MVKTGVVQIGKSPSVESGLPATVVDAGEPLAALEKTGSVQAVAQQLNPEPEEETTCPTKTKHS